MRGGQKKTTELIICLRILGGGDTPHSGFGHLALYVMALLLHSMQQKWDQGTLGTQRLTLIGSRTRHGPSMDPAIALK